METYETFKTRVLDYIRANYDVPDNMTFLIDGQDEDLEDWVEEYISDYNDNVDTPFGDDADEGDVMAVGDEILALLTSEDIAYMAAPAGARCQVRMEVDE